MRDIKFRVWDKKSKKMRQLINMVFNTGFMTERNDNSIKLIWAKGYDCIEQKDIMVQRENGFELMQYTGLKDKNGKEIYEGDIVKAYFKKGAWKYNDKNYFGYKSGKVQYCVDGFILYIENYKEKIYPLSSFGNNNGNINELEVIGNIYDNPDLLEKGAKDE